MAEPFEEDGYQQPDSGTASTDQNEQLIYGAQGPSTFIFDPTQQQGKAGLNGASNDVDDDEDEELEFEQVGGEEDLADAPKQKVVDPEQQPPESHVKQAQQSDGPSEALEIILEKGKVPDLKGKKPVKKETVPGSDRKSRIAIHNVNLLCLLVAIRLRAQLLFHDADLLCRILSQAPLSVTTPFQTAKSLDSGLDRSRAFEAALQDLVSWWWRSFDIDTAVPGLECLNFAKAYAKQPVPELPLDSDTSLSDKQKRKILAGIPGDHIRGGKSLSLRAVQMAGSSDISAQLFVSLCTAMDVPARLVISLQPLEWRGTGSFQSTDAADHGDETESGSESVSSPKRSKGKGRASAPSSASAKKASSGVSKLAKKAGINAAQKTSKFEQRKNDSSAAASVRPATDESDVEMEEVQVGGSKSSSRASSPLQPGGFMADQADVSEALRHAGPAPSLRRSKGKVRDFERSPSPDLRDMQRKPIFWAEVYNRTLKEWVTVDVSRKRIRCQGDMEPSKTDERNKMTYVIAIEQDGSIRDVTARYVSAFGAVTLKNRPPTLKGEREWWDRILHMFKRSRTLERDREEERQMSRNQTQEAMPTSIAGFKDHPLYALERHLKREEAIHPPKQLGLIKDEAVFPRSSVITVKSAEQWMREGMKVQEGEQPLKTVKSRAVTINRRRVHELARSEGREEDTMQGLYARWQTAKSIPPPVVDGVVPRNGYGNLDLFAPHMLPAGGAHLPYKGIAKVAKQLGLDYAEAITGFDFHKRRAVPTVDGIVVAKENEDVVLEAYWESEHASAEKAHNKKQDECLKRWKKLVAGLAIRRRLHSDYKPSNDEHPRDSEQRDRAAAAFVDQSQFGSVQDDETELRAKASASASEHQNSRPMSLRLVHNAPPPPINSRRRKEGTLSDSDLEQEEEIPADMDAPSFVKTEDQSPPSSVPSPPAPARPQRQTKASPASKRKASKRAKATASSGESESEPSDSDFEEAESAPKRPRRTGRQSTQTSKNTVAANR